MKQQFQSLLQNSLVQNAAALYGVQIGRKIVPLIIVPYLARTLGATGWGMVAFALSLGEFIVLIIEFGFNLSATREVARNRESKEACSEIAAGVIGAQAMLAFGAIIAAIFLTRWIPTLQQNPKLLAASLFYAVAQGFTPLWFFQGLERLRLAAALELSGKLLGVAAVLLFVHSADDGWIALLIQGLAPAVTTTAGLALAYQAIPFRWPTWNLVRDAFTRGWRMFLFRSGESLYGVGNAFILGLFAPLPVVGYFASAEKISKAAFGLLNPIRETLYPRLSHMVSSGSKNAAQLARIGALLTISGGVLLGATVFLGAPLLVGLVMGPGFEPAVQALRIFSALPPLLAITHSVGLQWLLPHGRDSEVNQIIIFAGLLNISLAFLLAPHFAHLGMACAVVSAEAFMCLMMVRATIRSTARFPEPVISPS